MSNEIWFSRLNDHLYFAVSRDGEPPHHVQRVQSVRHVFCHARAKGLEINQVGIVPPDMLGLE